MVAVSLITVIGIGAGVLRSAVLLEEGIVGLHVVGLDDEVVGGWVTGEDGVGRLTETASEAGLVAQRADVASADGLEGERRDDGVREIGLAVLVEQAQ